ncbi:glycyl-tRNA synthetase beta chain [Cetobacterium ceti]|uniref:Glycine--tRNA ligase beta subunit n=1 Tax=Cetobacterium ceti TaxID=180163 RepID=A0A1T4JTG2_9FUSO|nr:glycine--tRNA ligase subunit beta [Cetobacterium ceti]SJZ33385.1 glycyl-tRNA synthetase beta chain [Cetobacterium ceti]
MRLLFEIGMEEIPARFLEQALSDIKNNLQKKLKEDRIAFDSMKTYGTPRRLVLLVEGLGEKQEDLNMLNMGPAKSVAYDSNGEISRAGLGFAKSQGIEPKELELIETPKGEYIAARKFMKGEETSKLLPELLKSLVMELSFPNSMKWGEKHFRFARPIQWFLALADDEVVDFEIEDIRSGRKSKGHRFFGQEFEVATIDEYFQKIRENNVIIDIEERKNMIKSLIDENCIEEGEQVLIEPGLLSEVTNLVEYPYPIVGTFNSDFLEVPQDVLIISMEVHQRYFPILDSNGKLLPKFVVVRNGIDFSENVKKGNEKVLSARLADARFFYQEDLKNPLVNNVEKLKTVVFQKDLGTIYNKIERAGKVAEYLTKKLNIEDRAENVQRTILLAKADLVSNMIGEKEFTKLQGFMGADYALKSGEHELVSKGIEEHYYPRFQGDKLPTEYEGVIAGITDRLDTLCGCFGVGIIPSGSKDPFALRRAALGIVNIILNSKLDLSLDELVEESLKTLETAGVLKRPKAEVKKEIMEFFKQRAINVLTDMNYSKDVVLAVLDTDYDNLVEAQMKIEALEKFAKNEKFNKLVSMLKRVGNISKDHEGTVIDGNLLVADIEKELYTKSLEVSKAVEVELSNKEYTQYLETILSTEEVIDKYFESVMVMDKDENIKNNRLSQLRFISEIFNKIANLTLIEEK